MKGMGLGVSVACIRSREEGRERENKSLCCYYKKVIKYAGTAISRFQTRN